MTDLQQIAAWRDEALKLLATHTTKDEDLIRLGRATALLDCANALQARLREAA